MSGRRRRALGWAVPLTRLPCLFTDFWPLPLDASSSFQKEVQAGRLLSVLHTHPESDQDVANSYTHTQRERDSSKHPPGLRHGAVISTHALGATENTHKKQEWKRPQ